MNYISLLFFNHLPDVREEIRAIDGREMPCLILPTEPNQIKKGKKGNWLMYLRMSECPPNARQQTHVLQLGYLDYDKYDRSVATGHYELSQRLGRVYEHDRTPSKKVNRANAATDIVCDGVIILSDIPKNLIFRNAENDKRYLENLTFKSNTDDSLIYTGSVCVDDIPAHHIKTDPNTGKKYANTRFKKSDSLDTYMNTHKLVIVADDGAELEIGRFKEWQKTGGRTMEPPPVHSEDVHNTGVNQRQAPESIDGLKF